MLKVPHGTKWLNLRGEGYLRRWLASSLALLLGIVLLSGCSPVIVTRTSGSQPQPETYVEQLDEDLMDPPAFNDRLESEPVFGTGIVALISIPDGYRLTIRGSVQPYLRVEDNLLVVDLPGAQLAQWIALPPGVTAERVEPEAVIDLLAGTNGLNATIPNRMSSGGVRLTLPATNNPYALYRMDRETLDLRMLPPGLAGKRIVIDPGHGGDEPGASSPGGYPEKAINLAVAMLLKPMLEASGADVLMTRTEDTRAVTTGASAIPFAGNSLLRADLAERANLSNRSGADLFLSIHANGGPVGMEGIETFWTLRNLNASRSLILAGLIQQEMVRAYGFTDRGVKQRAFNVVRTAEAPAALAEVGFLTHPQEAVVLMSASGQSQIAGALHRALERYFGG